MGVFLSFWAWCITLRLWDFPGNQNHFLTTQNDTRDGVFSLLAVEIIRFLRYIVEKCVLW